LTVKLNWLFAVLVVAAVTGSLSACGVGSASLPPGRIDRGGVYEGTITGPGGAVNARLALGEVYDDGSFTAGLSYVDDPSVRPAQGFGTVWGTSFCIVMERLSDDAFYVEGHLDAATRRLVGTIRYPDRGEMLEFIFFYAGPVP